MNIKKILLVLSACFSLPVLAQDKLPITDFVKQVFITGVPYEQAVEYGTEDAVTLLKILDDSNQVDVWANAIVVLEIIGDEKSLNDIIRFLEKDPKGEYLPAHYRAKTAGIYGLGYFINHHKSKRAEKYLADSLNPSVWQPRGVVSVSSAHKYKEEQDIELSRYAALGLALAGTESSEATLKEAAQSKDSFIGKSGKDKSLVEDLLVEHKKIKNEGFKKYYEKAH